MPPIEKCLNKQDIAKLVVNSRYRRPSGEYLGRLYIKYFKTELQSIDEIKKEQKFTNILRWKKTAKQLF